MTVLSSANKAIIAGDGVKTAFGFSFNAGYAQNAPSPALALSYLSVLVTDASGNITTIAQGSGANQCQITLNAPVAAALWGLGGSVAYNPGGVPLPLGSTLTVLRTIPLTQIVALSNQGGLFPQTVEMAMDLLAFQIQQLSSAYGQAFVVAVSDPPPAPLPPAAQRANKGAAFDAFGNLIAGVLPASGVISSAMQLVVNAASLAAGRTAFGLGGMAVEGIGAGLADDGGGNARVISPITAVSSNQAVVAAFHLQRYLTSGPINFTLPRVNTLFNGFGFWLYNSNAGAVTLIIDSHDTVQGYASGQSVNIPPDTSVFISTDGANAGTILLDWGMVVAPPMGSGSFTNLQIVNNGVTPNTQINVTADELVIGNPFNGAVRKTTVSFTIDCTTVGANGMDSGALPASSWVYVFAISDGKTVAGLCSTSSTGPTLPSGFSYVKRLGVMRTDGSSHLLRTFQLGNKAVYQVVTGSNTTALPALISGNAGVSFWSAIAVAPFVPPTAAQIKLVLYGLLNASPSSAVAVVPNNNYSTSASSPSSLLSMTGQGNATTQTSQNQTAEINLEGSNIYFGASANIGSYTLSCYGWTDTI